MDIPEPLISSARMSKQNATIPKMPPMHSKSKIYEIIAFSQKKIKNFVLMELLPTFHENLKNGNL